MLIKIKRGWELPDSAATPESVFWNRRTVLKGLAAGPLLAAGAALPFAGGLRPASAEEAEDPSAGLYPVARNESYTLDRPLSPEDIATTYNNYYEFGSYKEIWQEAQKLAIRPWTVAIDGLVEEPMTVGIDDLLAKMSLEERLYRHRCVEAWSIAVPYSGFPLKALVDFARPLGGAKYLIMQTFEDDDVAGGQRQFWYPWPYTEGLTMAEATNELAFIATGYYGKPIPKQNGAPLRLAVPWKYGFKSIKSIVKIQFVEEQPRNSWNVAIPNEYGFYSNVNPEVNHPRWSQASERRIGSFFRMRTQMFNGYADQVAGLYDGMDLRRYY
jgi:sulfoxide reductase catalytic subunit YedY